MHPQLKEVIDEFGSASQRLRQLVDTVPADEWRRRPDSNRWSMAECVAHLNLTGTSYLPILDKALGEARLQQAPAPRRFRRDPIGWMLWRSMGPPVRHRVKTAAAFIPEADAPLQELLDEFERLQTMQVRFVEEADGLALHKVWVRSPFNRKVKYNLFSCLTMLPPHQHRHLWQAEQVREALDL
jgi:hypothetical protein